MIPDYQLFKATLRNYLITFDFQPFGFSQTAKFDVTPDHPKHPADFTNHNGRITLNGIGSPDLTRCTSLVQYRFQLTCWALSEPDAGYLGQGVANAIVTAPKDCMAMSGQTATGFKVDNYNEPVFYGSNELYYSVLQCSAWLKRVEWDD